MKIVFASNFFNHHQKPISDCFYKELGNDYFFIETSEISEERKNMGWGIEEYPPYVKNISDKDSQKLIDDADVVIFGSAPAKILNNRIKNNKIILRYSERPLKNGLEPLKYIPRFIKWHKYFPNKKNVFLLCASAYAYEDYLKFLLFKNRGFKWGYFPELREYESINNIIEQKKKNSIIWVSRLIRYKHPEIPVLVAKALKERGVSFNLTMIGRGELENDIKKMIFDYNLENEITLIQALTPSEVRNEMEKNEVFLFTSDRGEGWGAVLNEAMNSGCACVANNDIGAAPYLIDNDKNGVTYKGSDYSKIADMVEELLSNDNKRQSLGENAYTTIKKEWAPAVATNRLIKFCEALLNNESVSFLDGPCSKA